MAVGKWAESANCPDPIAGGRWFSPDTLLSVKREAHQSFGTVMEAYLSLEGMTVCL